MAFCSNCGNENIGTVKYCPNCGVDCQSSSDKIHIHSNESSIVVCPNCKGTSLHTERTSSLPCFIFGALGFILGIIAYNYFQTKVGLVDSMKYEQEMGYIFLGFIAVPTIIGISIGKSKSGILMQNCMKCGKKWAIN
jgi:hypothetical protein